MEFYSRNLANFDDTLIKLKDTDKIVEFAQVLFNLKVSTKEEKYNLILKLNTVPRKVIIVLCGPPGSGKTTLGTQLAQENKGIYLDQDMVYGQKGKPNVLYKQSVTKAILNGFTFIVLGKCHHLKSIRQDVLEVIPDDYNIIFAEFYCSTEAEFKQIVLSRIRARKNHQTLHSSNVKLVSILDSFFRDMEPISKDEGCIIKLDVSQSVENWMKQIELPQIMPQLEPVQIPKIWKPASYYSVDIEDITPVLPLISYDPEIKLQDKFHVTLRYYGNKGTYMTEKPYHDMLNKVVLVECLGYAADNNGVAIYVKIDPPCFNKYPHITLGVAEGIKPVYSNELLQKGIILFDIGVMLEGIISKH